MASFIPVIEREEEDRGRDISVGVRRGNATFTLPKLSLGELHQLKKVLIIF